MAEKPFTAVTGWPKVSQADEDFFRMIRLLEAILTGFGVAR